MVNRPKVCREIDPIDGKEKDYIDIELDTIFIAMLANGVPCSFPIEGRMFRLRHVKDPNYNFSARATLTPEAAMAAKELPLLMLLARLRGDDDPEIPQRGEFTGEVWDEACRRGFVTTNPPSEITDNGLAFLKAKEEEGAL